MEEKKQRFGEYINDKINSQRSVTITFPIKTFDNLADYAKKNTNDCYWMAIQELLTKDDITTSIDIKTMIMMDRDKVLDDKINSLKAEINSLYILVNDIISEKNNPQQKRKFYGGKRQGDEE